MWRALLIGIAVGACGGGNGAVADAGAEDAGVENDAFVRPDAGPSCGVTWELVPATINAVTLLDPAPLNSARTTRVLVTVEANACDERAMFTVARTFESLDTIIEARVWRPLGIACPPSTQIFERPVELMLQTPGTWTIHAGAATPITVDIGIAPSRPCMTGQGGCDLDCDCPAGEACLGGSGFAGPFTACARPCELDRDCGGEGTCISANDGLDFYCDSGTPECDAAAACPTGYACNAGACELSPTLAAATRKACACDDDCEVPLRCVEPAYPGATRHCEAVCFTGDTGDGAWCNGPHFCGSAPMDVAGTAPADSVCVWAGE